MDFAKIKIEDLIPHRGKMILIDEIIAIRPEYAVTSSTVSTSWPLLTTNGVSSLILVEIAAQSAGVCNGWDRIQEKGIESSKMGWLVGVKRAKFNRDFIPVASKIITRSENSNKYDNLRVTSSVSHIDGDIIGEVTLQLFQASDD
jgi:predicted hotdog family 3-hydroxylacyl-ACP dehydratase